MPRSTPTTASGWAGAARVSSASTVNATNQRPRSKRTVAERIRARPACTLRTSVLASSCSRSRPSRGSTACCAVQRIAPVVNRTAGRDRCLDLNRGNPTRLPFRVPVRELCQFCNARASWSRPVLNASFEHSRHHGATTSLAAFQSLRSEYSDHDTAGVRASMGTP